MVILRFKEFINWSFLFQMRLLVLMACVASAVLARPGTVLRPELNSHWENFKTSYNKNYEGGDESLRYY